LGELIRIERLLAPADEPRATARLETENGA
jgi:hypothetical protein